jgi:hypothetical protein
MRALYRYLRSLPAARNRAASPNDRAVASNP